MCIRDRQTGEEPLEVFEKALNNIMPVLEVKAKRIGGANYQVPVEVRPERRQTLGLRWLTKYTLSLIHIYFIGEMAMRFQHRSNFFVTPVVSPHQLDGVTGNIQQWVGVLGRFLIHVLCIPIPNTIGREIRTGLF